MDLTRRQLLKSGAAGLTALSLPLPALAGDARRILVVVQLAGGNDGLNTLAPVSDPRYRTLRPTIALTANEALPVRDTPLAFHASLAKLHALFERFNFAAAVTGQRGPEGTSHVDPESIFEGVQPTSLDDVLQRTVTHLLDGELTPEGWTALRVYLEVPDDPKAKTAPFAFDRRFVDGKLRGLLHLVLSTPEYQLS